MKAGFRQWLAAQNYQAATVDGQLRRASRVEAWHGNLDTHYDNDRLAGLLETLSYSQDDELQRRPNPCKVPFKGNVRANIASFRETVRRYKKFRDAEQ